MRQLALAAVAAVAGAAAGLSFEPTHWFALLPLAVAVLTAVTAGRSLRSGAWLGLVFGTAFMLVLLPWLRVIGVYAWIPLAVVEGAFYALAGLATSALTRPRAGRPGRPVPTEGSTGVPGWPVWVACSWVLVELLRGSVPFGGFPWGRLAFAAEDTPVQPALAYVGSAGASFVIALVGTTAAWAVLRRSRAGRVTLRSTSVGVLGLLGAIALAAVAGLVPWQATRPGDREVTIAAVQGNVPGQGLEAFAERRVVLDNHVEATERFAERVSAGEAPRPDLVVWPENSSDIDPYTDLAARDAIGDAATEIGAPLLMGAVVDRGAGGRWYNRAIVWSTDGKPGAYYDKTHPVPFGEYIPLRSWLAPLVPALKQIPEDMRPGTRPGVLQVGPARTGVLMCFEVAYDGLVRDVVKGGADVVVVPTNNATYTGTGQVEQQFAMSRLRAVETGRYVVVASTNGISGIVAPDGHVVARAPQRTQAVLDQRVTLIDRQTPATEIGAWLERGLAAAGVLAVALALAVRRRGPVQEGPGPVAVETSPTPAPTPVPTPAGTRG